jgi:Zn-dependent membrane protease YugP
MIGRRLNYAIGGVILFAFNVFMRLIGVPRNFEQARRWNA